MDSSDVNEIVGGGQEVILGADRNGELNADQVNNERINGMGDRWGSGRTSSTATIVATTNISTYNTPEKEIDEEDLEKGTPREEQEDTSRTQLGMWKDLRLVYAIVSGGYLFRRDSSVKCC